MEEMFVKNKGESKLVLETDSLSVIYRDLIQRFGYNLRISKFWEILPLTFGIPKFEFLDLRSPEFGFFENYLIDKNIEWENGKDINFSSIAQTVLELGSFSGREKLYMIDNNNLVKRLWVIFVAISFPDPELLINNISLKND